MTYRKKVYCIVVNYNIPVCRNRTAITESKLIACLTKLLIVAKWHSTEIRCITKQYNYQYGNNNYNKYNFSIFHSIISIENMQ